MKGKSEWTVALQAPPSVGFSRQEYESGVPLKGAFIPSGDGFAFLLYIELFSIKNYSEILCCLPIIHSYSYAIF